MTTLFSQFLKDNRPIFDSLFDRILSNSVFTFPLPSHGKSTAMALQSRVRGNKAYGSKRFEEALKYYSESVSVAPIESEELALAFGNRSAVLFVLKKYELSLLDINRALKGNCPSTSTEKLQRRKNACWTEIQAEKQMKLKYTKKILSAKSELNTIERKIFYVHDLSIDDSDLKINFDSFEDPVMNTKFDNPFLPNVSSKVKLATSAKWGRHWVAAKDIDAGEVLSIGKYFLQISPEYLLKSCSHCSIWCEALIPCLTCIKQMYCSERCRQEAYDSYHRFECKIFSFFDKIETCNISIALRMFLSGTKQGESLKDLIKDPGVYARLCGKWNCVNTHYPDDYSSMLNLNWKVDGFILHNCLQLASNFFNALRRVNFFGSECEYEKFQDFSDIELFAGFLIFHNLAVASQYCGKIEIDFMDLGLAPSESSVIAGCGIAPLQSLMNHSCNANTDSPINKRHLVTFSLRPIRTGEQIFTTYGFSYHMASKQERAQSFKNNFDMECQCIACVENWPTLLELMFMKDVLLTQKMKIVKNVKQTSNWLKLFFSPCVIKPSVSKVFNLTQENLEKALEFNSTVRKYLKEPSPTVSTCEICISACLSMKGGNLCILPSTAQILDEYSRVMQLE